MAQGTDHAILPLLRGMQLVALGCLLMAAVAVLGTDGPWADAPDSAGGLFAGIAVALSVLWCIRARLRPGRGRAVVAVLAIVLVTPVAVIGSVGFTIPVLFLVAALAVIDVSLPLGIGATVLHAGLGLVLHLVAGNGWVVGLYNTVPVLILLFFGVLLGASLRAYRDRLAERDRAVAAAEAATERLRRAADTEKELMLAEERARAAHELHDGLGHRLTAIRMSLEFAERMRGRDPEVAWMEVGSAREMSAEAMEEMRLWVRALSPVRPASATGVAAFEAIADSFRGTGVDVSVRACGVDGELPQETELLLYRAVQEGLTNALRHGRARCVCIALEGDTTADGGTCRRVRLRIRSDLAPAVRETLAPGPLTPGFGLTGLAERARALGGDIAAARVDDEVVLSLEVPLAAPASVPVTEPV